MATASVKKTAIDDNDLRYYKSYVDDSKLRQIVNTNGTLPGLNRYIRNNLNDWKTRDLNVAVTGCSGSGKSSLINALRNMKANSKGAAKVGVTETTTTPTKYLSQEIHPCIALWDLPGCGTRSMKIGDYVNDMKLDRYDVFIVVCATRFTENDLILAKAVDNMGKHILFVRTKIDFDLKNAKRDDEDAFNERMCIDNIKMEMSTHLEGTYLSIINRGIYLVSSPERSSYDLPNLLQTLKILLNKTSKAVPRLLQIKMEEMMKQKCNKLEQSFLGSKVVAAIVGFFPIPNLENTVNRRNLADIQQQCQSLFFLDNQSLIAAAGEIDKPLQYVKDQQDALFDIEQLRTKIVEEGWSDFSQYAKYIIPIAGGLVTAPCSVYMVHGCLQFMCRHMAFNETKLINLRLTKLEEEMAPFYVQT